MEITAAQVKDLRDRTGVGMMECKKALQESHGDPQKAILWLRERGLSRAAHKVGRAAAEGIVVFALSENRQRAILLECNCETDFSARNEQFRQWVNKAAQVALEKNYDSPQSLLKAPREDEGQTWDQSLQNLVSKVGENMVLRRLKFWNLPEGFLAAYSHMGGKIGTVVGFKGKLSEESLAMAQDVAMHVAASAPRYLKAEDISPEEWTQEKNLAMKKLQDEGRPEEMIEKILQGQMQKFAGEICLLQQPFVKNPKQTVAVYVEKEAPGVEIYDFSRFQVGEELKSQS